MRKRPGTFIILGSILVFTIVALIGIATDQSLEERIVASGFKAYDLSEPVCAISGADASCDTLDLTVVHKYTYRASPDQACSITFQLTGLWPFWPRGWKAYIDWDPEHLGQSSYYPMNARGPKGKPDKKEEAIHISIGSPTPDELWAWVQKHFEEPDEKCKPEA